MSKNSFASKMKVTLLKGMEAIGNTASHLASSAKLKVNEINLDNRRRELLASLNAKTLELWKQGDSLPQSLTEILEQIGEAEIQLADLRASRLHKNAASVPAADAAVVENGAAAPAFISDTPAPDDSIVPFPSADVQTGDVSDEPPTDAAPSNEEHPQ